MLKLQVMIKVIDIVYHHHQEFSDPEKMLEKHRPAFGFSAFTESLLDIQFVKHLNYKGVTTINGSLYAFFKSRNRFWWIPFTTHRYIKKQKPDIIIIEGLLFPLQLIALTFLLGKNCKFIVRHHGEKPLTGIKGFIQQRADKYIHTYLFTSRNNAAEWIPKIIKDVTKCVEVLEASTHFTRKCLEKSQAATKMSGRNNFLWVGRLITGKDPFTVLTAFGCYAQSQPDARLYMIYQDEQLLAGVKKMIAQSDILQQTVTLTGRVENSDLPDWYSAANFFISGSHREAAGYALLEAMACGCISLVTRIPAFEKITDNGKYGFLYSPGDIKGLTALLKNLNNIDVDAYRQQIEKHFNGQLSFKKIAADISALCMQLHSVKG